MAQRAIMRVLDTVYEEDFYPCSYVPTEPLGPLGAPQYAERAVGKAALLGDRSRHTEILRLDSALSPPAFLDQRVTDGVIRRIIDKWLNAGAVEDGLLHRTAEGSPRGGVVSPCLSNMFLHQVLDEWLETEVRPRLRGGCTIARYADSSWRSTTSSTLSVSWQCWTNVLDGSGLRSIRQDASRRLSPAHGIRRRMAPSSTSRPDSRVGTVAQRQGHGDASHGQGPFCSCAGCGKLLVPETPELVDPRSASPSLVHDAGPLRLLWRRGKCADSDVKPAAIPIKHRPPFRYEAGHHSNQRPAGFRH